MSLVLKKVFKTLNLGPKCHVCFFRQTSRLENVEAIVIFQISTLQFIKIQIFMQKNPLNLELKTHYSGIFGLEF